MTDTSPTAIRWATALAQAAEFIHLRPPTYSPTCLLITHDVTLAPFWDAGYRLEAGRLSQVRQSQPCVTVISSKFRREGHADD